MQFSGYGYILDTIREYVDGQGITSLSEIHMDGNKIRGVGNPLIAGDVVTLEYADSSYASKTNDNVFTGQNTFNGLVVLNNVKAGTGDGIVVMTSDDNNIVKIGTDGSGNPMKTVLINTDAMLTSAGGSIVDILVEDTYSYNHGIRIEGNSAGQNTSWIHLYDYAANHRVKWDYIGSDQSHNYQHLEKNGAIKEYGQYSHVAGDTFKVIGGSAANRIGTSVLTVNGALGVDGNIAGNGNLDIDGVFTGATSITTPRIKAVDSSGLVLANSSDTSVLTLGSGGGTDATFANGVNTGGQLSVGTSLLVDTINEKTAGNGVTVDGVELKDGGGVFTGNVSVDTILEKTAGNGVTVDGVELKDGGGVFSGKVSVGGLTLSDYFTGGNDLVIGKITGSHGVTIRSAADETGYILFADGTTSVDRYRGQVRYSHDTDTMEFITAGSIARMSITSDGIVNMPEQSGFKATRTTDQAGSTSAYDVIFNNDSSNQSFDNQNDYNTSNGIFTAPEDGFYSFDVSIYFDPFSTGEYVVVQLLHSDDSFSTSRAIASTTGYGNGALLNRVFAFGTRTPIYLNSGEQVKVRVTTPPATPTDIRGAVNDFTFFSGWKNG